MTRDYEKRDLSALRALGVDYDLDSPLLLVKKVHEVDGRITAACLLRISCETILFCQGSPKGKWAAMQDMQPAILEAAWAKGIDDLYAPIFTETAPRFRKRLRLLGWEQDRPMELWSRRTR